MSSVKLSTIKRLFSLSHNQCAYTDCTLPISEESTTITGEMAHIEAVSENGPRYNKGQTADERNSFSNLILLCSRHHKIIDTEIDNHSVKLLKQIKSNHETSGTIKITPSTTSIAKKILENYDHSITINNNTGQVVVNSPGAIQAKTVTLKATKKQVVIAPPDGSIASNRSKHAYVEYLIETYQAYQKQDEAKQGSGKYIIIYNAIKREFKNKWQILSEESFDELVLFLQKRINNTKIGRIRNKRNQKMYHSYEEH
jgi:hypothetical protein